MGYCHTVFFLKPNRMQCRANPKHYCYISLGHPLGANTEQIRNFSGISQVLVQCTKFSFRRGEYVYAF